MQKRIPLGDSGSSAKTCPKWELAARLLTSTLLIPWELSGAKKKAFASIPLEKAGQPQQALQVEPQLAGGPRPALSMLRYHGGQAGIIFVG